MAHNKCMRSVKGQIWHAIKWSIVFNIHIFNMQIIVTVCKKKGIIIRSWADGKGWWTPLKSFFFLHLIRGNLISANWLGIIGWYPSHSEGTELGKTILNCLITFLICRFYIHKCCSSSAPRISTMTFKRGHYPVKEIFVN